MLGSIWFSGIYLGEWDLKIDGPNAFSVGNPVVQTFPFGKEIKCVYEKAYVSILWDAGHSVGLVVGCGMSYEN